MQAVVWEKTPSEQRKKRRENSLKRLTYLVTAALVAMVLFVPSAFAQGMVEETMMMESTRPLPASGGMLISNPALVLPVVALLLGSGVLGYAVLRRR